MRILVADDEPLMSESLQHLLGVMGHDVFVAGNPAAAIDHMTRTHLDLVLLDWLMPDGGGQAVVSAMAAGRLPPTRIVLMTGGLDETLPEMAWYIPVLHKPFRLQDLQALLAG